MSEWVWLAIRTTPENKDIIVRAAKSRYQNVSNYLLQIALEESRFQLANIGRKETSTHEVKD